MAIDSSSTGTANGEEKTDPVVLVVDDNPLMVNVLKGLLGTASIEVHTSSNGREALEVLESTSVDVIVCDVMMPKMDGYAFHKMLREQAQYAHIPFVFLTALNTRDERNRGRASGADEYLVKPFDPEELLALVKGKVKRSRHLRKQSDERHELYRKTVVHTLSHEFRTPLVAINTGTELLLGQDRPDADTRTLHLLEAIRRGGLRLEQLVSDFMLLQQLEAGVARRLFDRRAKVEAIEHIVEPIVETRRSELEAEGFQVSWENHGANYLVNVYEPQIQDILKRFIDNAVKFSGDTKDIEAHICPRDQQVVVEVRDRGIGIDSSKINEALNLFGQIDRERLEQQGGGLGLAIAVRYARINGGSLELENREGGGTVARLLLPIHSSEH